MSKGTQFDIAIHNLAKDISNDKLTTDQLAHTAKAIEMAYGVPASEVAHLASSQALTWEWDRLRQEHRNVVPMQARRWH